MWIWTEMLIVFFFSRKQKLYEFRFVWVQKYVGLIGSTIGAHWNADYLLENFSPEDHEHVVDLKLKHVYCHLQCTCFSCQNVPWQKRGRFATQNPKFLIPISIFVNERWNKQEKKWIWQWLFVWEKKEEIWLNPVTKTPTPTEQSKKQRDNIKTPPERVPVSPETGRTLNTTAGNCCSIWLQRSHWQHRKYYQSWMPVGKCFESVWQNQKETSQSWLEEI